MYMMQISKVSSLNEQGTENLLLRASIILAIRSKYHTCDLRFLVAGKMLSHWLLVASVILAPSSKCDT